MSSTISHVRNLGLRVRQMMCVTTGKVGATQLRHNRTHHRRAGPRRMARRNITKAEGFPVRSGDRFGTGFDYQYPPLQARTHSVAMPSTTTVRISLTSIGPVSPCAPLALAARFPVTGHARTVSHAAFDSGGGPARTVGRGGHLPGAEGFGALWFVGRRPRVRAACGALRVAGRAGFGFAPHSGTRLPTSAIVPAVPARR